MIKFFLLWYKIHYAGRESKNIFIKRLLWYDKEARFLSFEKKGRNGSIPIFSDRGNERGEEYLALLSFFAEQFNLLTFHLLKLHLDI